MENRKRVLVVDDEPGILRFVRVSLGMAGYDVITTTSGEEALKLVETDKPDIMLLDILMVPMSGLDILDQLRTFSKLPVIVFTARSFIAEKAMELGANGVVAKPFKPEELVEKIKETLDNHPAR
jgi:two-component system KDP operon response regulator KdpE